MDRRSLNLRTRRVVAEIKTPSRRCRFVESVTPILRDIAAIPVPEEHTSSSNRSLLSSENPELEDWTLSPSPFGNTTRFFPTSTRMFNTIRTPPGSSVTSASDSESPETPRRPVQHSLPGPVQHSPVRQPIQHSPPRPAPAPPTTQSQHPTNQQPPQPLQQSTQHSTTMPNSNSFIGNQSNSTPSLDFKEFFRGIPILTGEPNTASLFLSLCDIAYVQYFAKPDYSKDVEFLGVLALKISPEIFARVKGQNFTKYEELREVLQNAILPDISLNDAITALQNLRSKPRENLKDFGNRVQNALDTLNLAYNMHCGSITPVIQKSNVQLAIDTFANSIRNFPIQIMVKSRSFQTFQSAVIFADSQIKNYSHEDGTDQNNRSNNQQTNPWTNRWGNNHNNQSSQFNSQPSTNENFNQFNPHFNNSGPGNPFQKREFRNNRNHFENSSQNGSYNSQFNPQPNFPTNPYNTPNGNYQRNYNFNANNSRNNSAFPHFNRNQTFNDSRNPFPDQANNSNNYSFAPRANSTTIPQQNQQNTTHFTNFVQSLPNPSQPENFEGSTAQDLLSTPNIQQTM